MKNESSNLAQDKNSPLLFCIKAVIYRKLNVDSTLFILFAGLPDGDSKEQDHSLCYSPS